MSKDSVIRFRASTDLKDRLEALAARKELDLSAYLRLKTIDLVEGEELLLGIKPPALAQKKRPGKVRRLARPIAPVPPAANAS